MILKKICTQKITFWFSLPCKTLNFCVLGALLKSTILRKKNLKKHDFEEFFFLKSMILSEKIFVKSMISNKNLFVLSDLKPNFLQRVGFGIKNFTMRQILNQLFKHASDFDLNSLQHVKFCVYFFYSLPSFHMYIKTAVLVMFEYMVWVRLVKLFCRDRFCVPQL